MADSVAGPAHSSGKRAANCMRGCRDAQVCAGGRSLRPALGIERCQRPARQLARAAETAVPPVVGARPAEGDVHQAPSTTTISSCTTSSSRRCGTGCGGSGIVEQQQEFPRRRSAPSRCCARCTLHGLGELAPFTNTPPGGEAVVDQRKSFEVEQCDGQQVLLAGSELLLQRFTSVQAVEHAPVSGSRYDYSTVSWRVRSSTMWLGIVARRHLIYRRLRAGSTARGRVRRSTASAPDARADFEWHGSAAPPAIGGNSSSSALASPVWAPRNCTSSSNSSLGLPLHSHRSAMAPDAYWPGRVGGGGLAFGDRLDQVIQQFIARHYADLGMVTAVLRLFQRAQRCCCRQLATQRVAD